MSDLAKRRAYNEQLLDCEPAIEPNGYEVPAQPWRFFTVEICCHDVVWAYDDDNLAEAAKSIEASDTDCDDYITYDLDETHENGEFKSYRPRAGYLRKVREGHRSRPGDRLATSRRPQGAFPR